MKQTINIFPFGPSLPSNVTNVRFGAAHFYFEFFSSPAGGQSEAKAKWTSRALACLVNDGQSVAAQLRQLPLRFGCQLYAGYGSAVRPFPKAERWPPVLFNCPR